MFNWFLMPGRYVGDRLPVSAPNFLCIRQAPTPMEDESQITKLSVFSIENMVNEGGDVMVSHFLKLLYHLIAPYKLAWITFQSVIQRSKCN